VLGSYFLNEKLGTLGKLGCATCLIGSVVIVLHAPPDRDIETVDEILNLAVQPGMCSGRAPSNARDLTLFRLLVLHRDCGNIREHHDIPRCAKIWPQEPACLHLHLLDCRICVRHVDQGIWYCPETHPRRQQPVYASVDIRIHHCGDCLHFDADELFQQSSESIFDKYVSIYRGETGPRLTNIYTQCQPTLLRNIHHRHSHSLFHPLRRLQHDRRRQHNLPPLRLPHHLHRRLPPQPLTRRPRRSSAPGATRRTPQITRSLRRRRSGSYRHNQCLQHEAQHAVAAKW
jgi:hypothetical protein